MSERPVALVTGASMGIGEAFAETLAARGYDLVLVARSADRLEHLAATLRAAHGVSVSVEALDLSDVANVEPLIARTEQRYGRIDLLVNNAGFGLHGRFATHDAARYTEMIRLNVESLVALSRRVLPGMLARRSGGIINVASTAGFQPVPFMAVYGATKAFVISFSEALHEEVRAQGVTVLALSPGQTATNFFAVSGENARVGTARTSQQVVETGLRALARRRSYAIDGVANRLLAFSARVVPRPIMARMGARIMGKGVT